MAEIARSSVSPIAARIACAPVPARRPAATCASSGSRSITRSISPRPRRHHPHHEPGLHALSRRSGHGRIWSMRAARTGARGSRSGWVEGEALRCFYHGWKFDSRRPVHRAAGRGECLLPEGVDPFAIRCASISGWSSPSSARARRRQLPDASGVRAVRRHGRDRFVQPRVQLLPESRERAGHEPIGFVHGDNVAIFKGIGLGPRCSTPRNPTGA